MGRYWMRRVRDDCSERGVLSWLLFSIVYHMWSWLRNPSISNWEYLIALTIQHWQKSLTLQLWQQEKGERERIVNWFTSPEAFSKIYWTSRYYLFKINFTHTSVPSHWPLPITALLAPRVRALYWTTAKLLQIPELLSY